MKILVTGGSGFIGSHLVDLCLEKGDEVTVFDRRLDVQPSWVDWDENVSIIPGDIKNPSAVDNAVRECDAVVHLAGILGTSEIVDTPVESIEVNIKAAINVYESIKHHDVPAVQITVGNIAWFNSYAISKYAAERFALMYNREFGTKIAVVRGLNVYGERQKHYPVKKVIPNFMVSALRDELIPIYGDGEQLLDVIYVGDNAEILYRALTKDHGVYDHPMEAGTGKLISVNELARRVIDAADSSSTLKHIPMRAGEPNRSTTKADPSTLAPLDYVPSTKLQDGLKRTATWYRDVYIPYLEEH